MKYAIKQQVDLNHPKFYEYDDFAEFLDRMNMILDPLRYEYYLPFLSSLKDFEKVRLTAWISPAPYPTDAISLDLR